MERSYIKSFVSLWEILEFLFYFLFFNTYETIKEFETCCEKPVASQPSLHVRDKTILLLEKEEICSKKREGDWIIKLLDMYCTKKKHMKMIESMKEG